ncbi:hypothetical protein [Brevundimonas sp.]|uniref:hypothetical protein n=1 Tax=Brevundimonas sp. TaxID=1871086 RepID=UPI00286B8742|nr:hypothetical protein [Brevundimonas sp.]
MDYSRRRFVRSTLKVACATSTGALFGCGQIGSEAFGDVTVNRAERTSPILEPTPVSPQPSVPANVVTETIFFQSSIDPVSFPNIRMIVTYRSDHMAYRGPLPILFLGHGTNQIAAQFPTEALRRYADRGFFVVTLEMRFASSWAPGMGYDAMGRDSQGRMTRDVIDALWTLRKRFGNKLEFGNRTYAGYSGSEAFALAMKAPWAFDLIVAYFCIPEYRAHRAFGGTVQVAAQTPGGYASRNALIGVPRNRRSGHLIVAWDTQDEHVSPASQQQMVDELTQRNQTPFAFKRTSPADAIRVIHGIPAASVVNFAGIEDDWLQSALSGHHTAGRAPARGTDLYIGGYIWIGDPMAADTPLVMLGDGATAGQQHSANLSYDLNARSFDITPLNGPTSVTIGWRGSIATRVLTERAVVTL